jgi:hypothetical protein
LADLDAQLRAGALRSGVPEYYTGPKVAATQRGTIPVSLCWARSSLAGSTLTFSVASGNGAQVASFETEVTPDNFSFYFRTYPGPAAADVLIAWQVTQVIPNVLLSAGMRLIGRDSIREASGLSDDEIGLVSNAFNDTEQIVSDAIKGVPAPYPNSALSSLLSLALMKGLVRGWDADQIQSEMQSYPGYNKVVARNSGQWAKILRHPFAWSVPSGSGWQPLFSTCLGQPQFCAGKLAEIGIALPP